MVQNEPSNSQPTPVKEETGLNKLAAMLFNDLKQQV
jgi:hypothetical protein